MNGRAYVFIRKDGAPLPLGCAGHVAWGVELADGTFFCGSTENPGGAPIVLPGGENGWWGELFNSEAAACAAVRARNYDGYKVATVRDAQPEAARTVGEETRHRGYQAVGGNCLDHAWDVLKAYSVKDLPWAQTHPSPNDWFAVFNGEYHNLE